MPEQRWQRRDDRQERSDESSKDSNRALLGKFLEEGNVVAFLVPNQVAHDAGDVADVVTYKVTDTSRLKFFVLGPRIN